MWVTRMKGLGATYIFAAYQISVFQKIKESLGRTLHTFQKQPLAAEPSEPWNSRGQGGTVCPGPEGKLPGATESVPISTKNPWASGRRVWIRTIGSGNLRAPRHWDVKESMQGILFFPRYRYLRRGGETGTEDPSSCENFAFSFIQLKIMTAVQHSTYLTEVGERGQ